MEFEKNIQNNYKVLIIPFPYVINQKIARKINAWVKNGGVLISERYTAGRNIEKGHHEKVVPGYGFDNIFKVKQTVVESAENGKVKIVLDKDLPYLKKGSPIVGTIVKETYFNNGATVIASFESGEPAIFISKFGKGRSRATFGPVRVANDYSIPHPHSQLETIVAAVKQIRARHRAAIQRNFPRTWRNSAGYRLNYLLPWTPSIPPAWDAGNYPPLPESADVNLAHLLAGSEGTLAVFRELTVGLVPRPKHTVLGILAFDELTEACAEVPRLLEHGPSAIELVPRLILRAARGVAGYAGQMIWLRGDPAAILLIEFSGDEPHQLEGRLRAMGAGIQMVVDAEEQSMVWATRKAGLGLLDSKPQTARPVSFIEDCAIPVEDLAAFVGEIQRIMDEHGAAGGIYVHASAGRLHIRPILDLGTPSGRTALRSFAEQTKAVTPLLRRLRTRHGDGP